MIQSVSKWFIFTVLQIDVLYNQTIGRYHFRVLNTDIDINGENLSNIDINTSAEKVLGYFSISIPLKSIQSNYIFPKCRYRQLCKLAGHSFQVRKPKLYMNDHHMPADVLGYSDIRIFASVFFRCLALKAVFWKLGGWNLVSMILYWKRMFYAILISEYPHPEFSDI